MTKFCVGITRTSFVLLSLYGALSLSNICLSTLYSVEKLFRVMLAWLDTKVNILLQPGCLSDALGLGESRAWSALASPASPPVSDGPRSLRADSTPPTPAAHLSLQPPPRPASALPDREPDLVEPGIRV